MTSDENLKSQYSIYNKKGKEPNYNKNAEYDMPSFDPKAEDNLEDLIPENFESEEDIFSNDEFIKQFKEKICPECSVEKEAEASRLRALAELDNARKRMAREKEEYMKYAAEPLLNDIIPSIDNLELALKHADSSEACKNFVLGVAMTKKILMEALAKHGLVQVGLVGEEFDPTKHEAVGVEASSDVQDGHISSLVSHGYMLNSRLLRPAKVMVAKA